MYSSLLAHQFAFAGTKCHKKDEKCLMNKLHNPLFNRQTSVTARIGRNLFPKDDQRKHHRIIRTIQEENSAAETIEETHL